MAVVAAAVEVVVAALEKADIGQVANNNLVADSSAEPFAVGGLQVEVGPLDSEGQELIADQWNRLNNRSFWHQALKTAPHFAVSCDSKMNLFGQVEALLVPFGYQRVPVCPSKSALTCEPLEDASRET